MSHPSSSSSSSARVREGDPLTGREIEILGFVAGGERTPEIARRLGISENTVKSHLTRVYRKIGASSRVQAARHYLAHHASEQPDLDASASATADERSAPAEREETFLARQIEEIRARIDRLSRTIIDATAESQRLEDALAALIEIKARHRPDRR
ncbi:MAG: 33-cGAMP-specific phosphodiesterase 3 [Conexibacter sp.]|nr:33-cGAMP-specific phosphodiesterase 3 [Conexibacter sp.]